MHPVHPRVRHRTHRRAAAGPPARDLSGADGGPPVVAGPGPDAPSPPSAPTWAHAFAARESRTSTRPAARPTPAPNGAIRFGPTTECSRPPPAASSARIPPRSSRPPPITRGRHKPSNAVGVPGHVSEWRDARPAGSGEPVALLPRREYRHGPRAPWPLPTKRLRTRPPPLDAGGLATKILPGLTMGAPHLQRRTLPVIFPGRPGPMDVGRLSSTKRKARVARPLYAQGPRPTRDVTADSEMASLPSPSPAQPFLRHRPTPNR